jgi:hypothetical protein
MKKCQNGWAGFIACTKMLVVVLVVTFLLLPYAAPAQEEPLPCRFHGTVQINGHTVPDGILVKAIIGGNEVASVAVPAVYGPSTYALIITQPAGLSYSNGTEIRFKIHVYDAVQKATWVNGGNIALNLTASTLPTPTPAPSPTPFMTPTSTPSTTPSGTPTPTLSPTPNPILTPTPAPPTPTPEAASNTGWVVGVAVMAVLGLVLLGVLAYLVWRWFFR